MRIPSIDESLKLLERFAVPDHITRHSMQVARVGVWLSENLKIAGVGIDRHIVEVASLLHDISKMESIIKGGRHAAMGYEKLKRQGYDEIAEVVRQHVKLDRLVSEIELINEAMVVNYADKRVRHEEVVSLEERFKDLFKRYATTEEKKVKMQFMYEESILMEKKIFSNLKETPDELTLHFKTNIQTEVY